MRKKTIGEQAPKVELDKTKVRISPLGRKVARETGIDLKVEKIVGAGSQGRIMSRTTPHYLGSL